MRHNGEAVSSRLVRNPTAYIPPQCYVQVDLPGQAERNPCSSCHTQGKAPNFLDDSDLQRSDAFPELALTNRWQNLFRDRRAAIEAISDAEILPYVRTNNYQDSAGRLTLADALRTPPPTWDSDRDGRWAGFKPDCYFQFDAEGFDHALDGSLTGWRSFAYAPFPGVSLPNQGSMGDALIRLPALYQQREDGQRDLEIYRLNLAIVEAIIKRTNIPIAPVQEEQYGVDLNRDGSLTQASEIVYAWAPRQDVRMSFVGAARAAVKAGKVPPPTAGLYPTGTEFLHSVRYLDVNAAGEVVMGQRMKELRYARKVRWLTYAQLSMSVSKEAHEKRGNPDQLKRVMGDQERGVSTGNGWILQGFIEDSAGALRPQTFEEQLFCVGCHSGIGATTDATFAFPRKVTASTSARGWSHPLRAVSAQDQLELAEAGGDITPYLQRSFTAGSFGEDTDVDPRLFDRKHLLKLGVVKALTQSLSPLLPSRAQALMLNKAYRLIVQEQSYTLGRDATVTPARFVHRQL